MLQAELLDAVRRRRAREDNTTSDDEEDLGLPRSPSSNSPTTADVLLEKVLKVSHTHITLDVPVSRQNRFD